MVEPMLRGRHIQGGTRGVRLRIALTLAAVACAAPATAAATGHLRGAAPARPAVGLPQSAVAGGQATGSVEPGREPAGGWLGAIAP